jgi:adenylate cyclase
MPEFPSEELRETTLREVTLLFVDVRGSSALAQSLEIEQSCLLLSDVLESLTTAVLDHGGAIIDYYGDGLAAMWNAPTEQSNHAELACRAGTEMLASLPDIETRWSSLLRQPLGLGVGVHTGIVQVGNSGSSQKWKYGPRGANVHLASRVESATKELRVPLLATEATASRLSARFICPRLCRVRLPGISEPIELYGVWSADAEPSDMATYEHALIESEAGQLDEAATILATIDPAATELPVAFLRASIEKAQSQRKGRRRTDQAMAADMSGAIVLDVK